MTQSVSSTFVASCCVKYEVHDQRQADVLDAFTLQCMPSQLLIITPSGAAKTWTFNGMYKSNALTESRTNRVKNLVQ